MLPWSFAFVVTVIHVFVVLISAPWVMVFQKWVESKIQSDPTISFKWSMVNSRRLHLRDFRLILNSNNFTYLYIAIGIVVIAGALVPTFTAGLVTAPISDLFLIITLLMLPPIFFSLNALQCSTSKNLKSMQILLVDTFLYFPALFLICTIIYFITGSTLLNSAVVFFHQLNEVSLRAYCPLLIASLPLLFLQWDLLNYTHKDCSIGFGELQNKIITSICDIQYVVWLSLIAIFIWPQSVAILPAGAQPFMPWLSAALFGFLAWVVKIIFECFIIALMRSLFLFSSAMYRVGISVVLSLLAIILYFAGLSGS